MPVLKNVVVRNSRVVTPVTKSWGKQYSLVIESAKGHLVGTPSDREGQFWLNWSAQYPSGDLVAPIAQVRGKTVSEDPTEFGDGSVVDLAFDTVERDGKQYHNLKAIKVIQFVKPRSVVDFFDDDEFGSDSKSDAPFDDAVEF